MTVTAPTTGAHWEQFTAIQGQSFATAAAETAEHIESVRHSAIARFAFEDDRVVAGAGGGDPADLALMDALTADRRPWLPDMF